MCIQAKIFRSMEYDGQKEPALTALERDVNQWLYEHRLDRIVSVQSDRETYTYDGMLFTHHYITVVTDRGDNPPFAYPPEPPPSVSIMVRRLARED